MTANSTTAQGEWVTKSEAAKMYRVHKRTLERRIDARQLPAYRFGGKVLIKRSDLDALLTPVNS